VIAPHRSLENPDRLPSILRRVTKMPVVEVEQGMRIEPDHVFVMPPRTDMTVQDDMFLLRKIPPAAGWPKTISVFLFSLAEMKGSCAVAVIVSGMDHDGTTALKAIKDAGGVTFAQSDASHQGMPRHAVETGHIDYFLPCREIGPALLSVAPMPM
jgi:two-component system CheB/CheR fusion protein